MGKKDKKDKKGAGSGEEQRLRIAIVSEDRCKPKKCQLECKKYCPVNRTGKFCVEVDRHAKVSWISETLCIGCGICVKKCPFDAITVINLPKDLSGQTTHRYGPNTFKLHRLPMPRPGQVLGLVGTNGIGKSTALKILSGKLKPNLGRFDNPPDWSDILQYFRGSDLQNYFVKILEDKLKATIKPQYVGETLARKDERHIVPELLKRLDLEHLVDREIKDLSGGELQRFAIAVVCELNASVYMFDEPSSYLDVRQRLEAAHVIRDLQTSDNYIIVVEHDLSVLDYLSDYICCLWGTPTAYGVVTMPFSVREGINIFLDGFIPTENLRFREVALNFRVSENTDLDDGKRMYSQDYPAMTKTMGNFKLHIEGGSFSSSEIIVMLGQNGTGKTTFIRMLAGLLKPDESNVEVPRMNVSYKPQTIHAKFDGSVRDLLHAKIRSQFLHPQFVSDVTRPMLIDQLLDQNVQNLSGGELQRVAIVLALGKPADVYLIDEPSAYLDVEQRVVAARVIKRFILHAKKTAFVVEHDFIMASYLADRVVVYDGHPGVECTASTPETLVTGMNKFLKSLEITFRRDPTNYRPRINKYDSVKDKEQKAEGNFFLLED
ncbi:ATP-binding cassette sub- E member 1 [Perkinsus olseni]|uniref:ATP-binding cassette sub- E member 1 n=2 Tax=Perkinsus olseni TaxID=32597 RepID=A0A7J6PI90_PEROL|nr:ATP-binding cassette sub- E member 1 [Perkinsus olseni]